MGQFRAFMGSFSLFMPAHRPRSHPPPHLLTLQSIHTRLPEFHPKKQEIELNLAQLKAGFQGEKSIDFYLTFINPSPHHIYHNIRLHDGQHFFQIDTLILFQNVIFILEVKNIAGRLDFKTDFSQVIRTLNDQTEAFSDFHLQVERQRSQLEHWLSLHHFPVIPIIPLIVMSNTRTIITSESKNILQNVIPSAQIAQKIHQLIEKTQTKKITQTTFNKLSKSIQHAHTDLNINWLKRFDLNYEDLQKGVPCLVCGKSFLLKKQQHWSCPTCHNTVKNAHELAMEELFLIKGEGLSNAEIREFFAIKDRKVMARLLQKLDLKMEGTYKVTRYYRNQKSSGIKT